MSDTAPAVPVDDAAWPTQTRRARISMRPLTAVLTTLLIAAVAVYAGARLEKSHGGSSGTSSGSLASAFAARRGAGGFGGFGAGAAGGTGGTGAAGGLTTGTVTEVTPKLLYLTSSSGSLIKIALTAKTTFTRTAASPKGGLSLGDTAIVRGAKNASGVLVATSVIATAKGVTSTFGGGGGFGGGFGGGAGSRSSGAATGG
jgi:hypothetical protein